MSLETDERFILTKRIICWIILTSPELSYTSPKLEVDLEPAKVSSVYDTLWVRGSLLEPAKIHVASILPKPTHNSHLLVTLLCSKQPRRLLSHAIIYM